MKIIDRLKYEYHIIMHDYHMRQSVMVPQKVNFDRHIWYVTESFHHGNLAMKLGRKLGLDWKLWS